MMESSAEVASKSDASKTWISDLRSRSKNWDDRRAQVALSRLDSERSRLHREREQQEREIANVEQQISLLLRSRTRAADSDSLSDSENGMSAAGSHVSASALNAGALKTHRILIPSPRDRDLDQHRDATPW